MLHDVKFSFKVKAGIFKADIHNQLFSDGSNGHIWPKPKWSYQLSKPSSDRPNPTVTDDFQLFLRMVSLERRGLWKVLGEQPTISRLAGRIFREHNNLS